MANARPDAGRSRTAPTGFCAAAQHEMGLARAPKTRRPFRSPIKNNLLTEINAPREHVGLGWRQDEDGTWIVARITDEGLRAGIDPNKGDAVTGEPDCSGIEGSVPDRAPTVAPAAERATQDATAAEANQAAPTETDCAADVGGSADSNRLPGSITPPWRPAAAD